MDLVKKAEFFARGAHAGQHHGERPFWTHPRAVADNLRGFFHQFELEDELELLPDAMVAAAWLHDTIEDTPTTYQDIKHLFGHLVAETVWAVTDEMGRTRHERKEKTYPKIFASPSSTLLKLADLKANIEASVKHKSKQLQMYQKEWETLAGDYLGALETHGLGALRVVIDDLGSQLGV